MALMRSVRAMVRASSSSSACITTIARRQGIERAPDRVAGHERRFRIGARRNVPRHGALVPAAHVGPAPLIAPDVDQDADEPRLFVRRV
jgi:hypothetical protein